MNEYFLHFIWQYQFFDKQSLKSSSNENISVLSPGYSNKDQGPDFSHARLLIDNIEWHGNVEIHLKASDWYAHHHQKDKNYDAIILHVVWENDRSILREDGSTIPVLELKDRVNASLIDQYKIFVDSGIHLPCAYYKSETPTIFLQSMLSRVMIERLERKAKEIIALNKINKNDWRETFWQLLFKSFGHKINGQAFEQLSRAVPYKIVVKHSHSLFQLEAMLFGQSGLLDLFSEDEYTKKLQEEYSFLAHKYGLSNQKMGGHIWKFMRTRPYNFPTIRIAQLASLIQQMEMILNMHYDKKQLRQINKIFVNSLSPYWNSHFRFGENVTKPTKGISEASFYAVLINVIIPYKIARGIEGAEEPPMEELVHWLEQLPAEKNNITKKIETIGLKVKTAFDSQASIELYTQYCLKRNCLYCSVGTQIIKNVHGNIPAVNTGTHIDSTP